MLKLKLISRQEIKNATGIAASSLGLYIKKGLIPYPKIESNYMGKKGRFGLYPEWVIERIKKIKGLIDEGYTLDSIKERLDSENSPEERKKIKKMCRDQIDEMLTKEILSREDIDEARNLLFLGWGMGTGPASEIIPYFAKKEKAKE